MLNEMEPTSRASVQVWGKGYRVSADSEEFQRFVPQNSPAGAGIEVKLPTVQWGRVIEPLYTLAERELTVQRAVLFMNSEILTIAFARTEDRHRRPSIVMISAVADVNWASASAGEIVSRAVSLALRLAVDYGSALTGNPEAIGEQLRENAFLPERRFNLADEREDVAVDWRHVVSAVRKFRGVSGVATLRLASIGANILLGTRYEAERAQQQQPPVDGFYDVRERQIKPLSGNLLPWAEEASPVDARVPTPPAPQIPDLKSIAESLERIDGSLHRLVDVLSIVVQSVFKNERRRK